MNTKVNLPVNRRTIGIAVGILLVLVVYVRFADFFGVLGGILFGGLTGAAVAGGTGLYQVLFARKT